MTRKLAKFRALSWRQRLLLTEATLYLAAARLAIAAFSFRVVKKKMAPKVCRENGLTPESHRSRVKAIGRALRSAARHCPWESKCMVQAIAGKLMLDRRGLGSTIFIGIKKDESRDLLSHAWLCSGDCFVTGWQGHDQFKIITTLEGDET